MLTTYDADPTLKEEWVNVSVFASLNLCGSHLKQVHQSNILKAIYYITSDINAFRRNLDGFLSNINMSKDLINCNDMLCNND